ncbi:TonB-dependent receptor [Novosphingobium mangrovi (ex Huang et al. 2023)]|uniref:TonB-dependent receptor n=1 Tax=Novosphingobium mangrovi (ex Huang et al. 2023) TaxID=2976432 RepID=A0ABT2I1H4_9SPHN|nr:TonB-dependent receptor [Novosphingobium mangrovi (ex Huang et al. 2023)]MCT2398656.1 TonB-dependent receptor [Novosphingobium mangrovi (ex Huang et al. 2023)]
MIRVQEILASTAAVALMAAASSAEAQDSRKLDIILPAQPLGASLRTLAQQSGSTVLADDTVIADRQAPAIRGSYTLEQALTLLLAGSGLSFDRIGKSFVVRRAASTGDDNAIVVTGSRIRGAPVASPVIRIGQQDMRDEGQTSLGDVVRSIPQAFGGGQNPGVGNNVPASSGINVGSASTINLRGLGSDATLTLIDGHRLAYNGSRQGIDVSAIPLSIVDRIEIVADGASALYGSDAVAGVANVILKRDYQGLETRADIGGATDGGDFSQRYGAVPDSAGRREGSSTTRLRFGQMPTSLLLIAPLGTRT